MTEHQRLKELAEKYLQVVEQDEQGPLNHVDWLLAGLLAEIGALEKDKTLLSDRLRMGPPSGRGDLSPHEREELRGIAEARASYPATKRVADLIFVALDVLEQTDVKIECRESSGG